MTDEFHTLRGYQLMEQDKSTLTSAMEDYLEMIFRQCNGQGYTRVNILADKLNVQAPSVTKMVQKLAELGYLNYQRYGIIHLTDEGKRIGQFLINRHTTIEKFLTNLGLRHNLLEDTEKLEHSVSEIILERLAAFNSFIGDNPKLHNILLDFFDGKED